MTDPAWTAMVQSHLDELRSEAANERLAALAHPARRRCPARTGQERCPAPSGRTADRLQARGATLARER